MLKKQMGFTIVELLIVIVVIGILAAITIVAFNGVQDRANNSRVQSAVNQAQKALELFAATNGAYPSTGGLNVSRTDANCTARNAIKATDWIPDLPASTSLAQSEGHPTGVGGRGGCYIYASDGQRYVISAWNMVAGGPQNGTLYKRLGFREVSVEAQFYYCNHTNIGGNFTSGYNPSSDYYKHSYTVSNITGCNETPPAGA